MKVARKPKKMEPFKPLTADQQRLVEGCRRWCRRQSHHWAYILTWRDIQDRFRAHVAEELYAGALLGAVYAASRFDPSSGYSFLTYAHWYIRSEMIRVARSLTPIGDSFAHRNGVPRELQTGQRPQVVSLSTHQLSDDGYYERLDDCIPDRHQEQHESETVQRVKMLIAHLRPRDRKIVEMLYDKNMTLLEAGKQIGVSKERVRQLRERILHYMRRAMASNAEA